jgi:hypothetical protein
VYLSLDSSLLDATRAATMALPAAGLPPALARLRRRGWAVVAPLSILAVAAAIELSSASADALAWIALLLVPPGCALALAWAARDARPWLAVLALPLVALALAAPGDTVGELARIVLIGGSCVTVGRLLAGAAPLTLVKLGLIAMATVDAVQIFGHLFDQQNAVFEAAVAAPGLPQLQRAQLGTAGCDYGDFFAAGLAGAVVAAEGRPQLAAAAAMWLASELFNQLFLVTDILPMTVPPAVVLLGLWVFTAARERATLRQLPAPLSRDARSAPAR